MSVRTGKGDTGYTDLLFNKVISKDHIEMKAIGDIDELVSYLGLVKVKCKGKEKKEIIEKIQRALCVIASEIAVGEKRIKKNSSILKETDVAWIKKTLFDLEEKTPMKSQFYLPSDSEVGAYLDISRTIARRSERSVVELFRKDREKNRYLLAYLNCISDVLFVMAREKKPKRKVQGVKRKGRK